MKYLSLLSLLLLSLVFISCEDDEDPFVDSPADVRVAFTGEFAGRPLAIQRERYAYPGDDQLLLQLFQYYVSDLELLPADGGDPVHLSELELVRYQSAQDDNVEPRTFSAPAGEYRGLRFGLGVKPELNRLPPNNFAADFLLNESEYWGEAARYVFAKIEARADLSGDGRFTEGISIHMGSDAMYRNVTLDEAFTLRPGSDNELTVLADVFAAMGGTENPYDITVEANRRVHGRNQDLGIGIYNRLAENFRLAR